MNNVGPQAAMKRNDARDERPRIPPESSSLDVSERTVCQVPRSQMDVRWRMLLSKQL